jgi:DnaJ-class molecular chaperone
MVNLRCPYCDQNGNVDLECQKCDGNGFYPEEQQCPQCLGSGWVDDAENLA